MKKLVLFITCLLTIITNCLGLTNNYNFSAVCSTGQTLYYKYNNGSSGTSVSVTYPCYNARTDNPNYYENHNSFKPTGSLTIPASVTYGEKTYSVTNIYDHTFYNCTGLTSVTIPNSVKSIKESAFQGCTSLAEITIPNSVTSIGKDAFWGCTSLAEITIPNSVKNLGIYAFSGCTGLTSVTIGNGVTSIGAWAFSICSGLTSVTIPSSVTSIEQGAFARCSTLTSVTIPNSVVSIGDLAFWESGLTSVIIPNSVTTIAGGSAGGAFQNCSKLTSVTIGNGVESIEGTTFFGCKGLTELTIGSSVTSIGNGAFNSCTNLTKITCYATTPPTFGTVDAFARYGALCYVPEESVNLYKAADGWKNFYIVPFNYIVPSNPSTPKITVLSNNTSMGSVTGGGNYQSNATATLTATANDGYAFVQWQDGNTDNPRTITVTENATYIATFAEVAAPTFTITALPYNASMGSVTGGGSYAENATATLTATANNGYAFVQWSDGNTNNPRSITVTENAYYIATFAEVAAPTFTITALPNNANMGSVTGGGNYAENATATLTATANDGYAFAQWQDGNTDNPRSITVTEDAFYIATFAEGYTITATANYASRGSVTGGGSYQSNATATLTATAAEGYIFVAWNDGNTENPRSVVVTQDSTFTATFATPSNYDHTAVCETGQVLFYKINDDGTTVSVVPEYSSSPYYTTKPTGNLVIPSAVVIAGTTYTVTNIGEYAFYGCSGLTSISIPTSVTSIGSYAFRGCTGLTEVIIPNSVTSIERFTFRGCSGLTSISIPTSVTSIGNNAFYQCSRLTSVTIPTSVTSIGNSAFNGCSALASVYCEALTPPDGNGYTNQFSNYNIPLYVPASSIEAYRSHELWGKFANIRSSELPYTITVTANSTGMGSVTGGGSYEENATATLTATAKNSYVFVQWNDGNTENPRNVVVTQDSTFTAIFAEPGNYDHTAACETGQVLFYKINNDGTTVSVIPEYSSNPYYTTKPTGNLVIPSAVVIAGTTYTVTNIEKRVFCGCSGLTSVTIPTSVTSIGVSVFSGCTGLTSVTIPNSVTSIGGAAFYECSGLSSVTIPNSVTSIEDWAFYQCSSLTSVTIPTSVTSIGRQVFAYCTGLTSVTIPSTVTSIGDQAFGGCSGLTSVTIPNSVTSIGEEAFAVCTGLTGTLTIPSSVTNIGKGAFSGCSGLTAIDVTESNATYQATDGVLYNNDATTLICYPAGETGNFTIPTSVTSIEYAAFYGSSGLTSVTIPSTITSIGERAFQNCIGLTAVYCQVVTPPEINQNTFTNVSKDIPLYVPESSIEAYRNHTVWGQFTNILPISEQTYTITATAANTAMGSVTGGGSYEENATATLTATANSGYNFVGWNDGNNENPRSVVVTQDSTFTATFAINTYIIAANANDANMGSVTGGNTYNYGETAILTATANDGYAFVQWQDGNTDNPRSVVVTKDSTFTATFAINTYNIAANANDANMGSVTGGNTYNYGETATLTATANDGYAFVQWQDGNTDNPRSITVTKDSTFIAVFVQNTPTFTITALSNNASMGSVTGGGTYEENTTATLTATANDGYAFAQWQDGNTDNPRSITVTENAYYIATFTEVAAPTFTITALSSNTTMGSVTGGGNYAENATATLTATANDGYAFAQWQDGNTDNPRSITVTENAYYIATFAETVAPTFTITALSNNASMGSVTGGGTYEENATATLTATANDGYAFAQWQDGNTDNPRSITVTENAYYIATFAETVAPTFTITALSSNASMGSVTGGGNYAENATATLTATANDGYAFAQWQDGNTDNPRSITVTENAYYIATFAETVAPTFTITALSSNASMGSVTGGGNYAENATATLTATANDGYAFVQWQDGNTNNPRSITVTENAYYIATFAINTYIVKAEANDATMGSVTGGNTYNHGETATLTATPVEGYRFVAWNDGNSENPRSVVVIQDSAFTATFTANAYIVKAEANDATMGSVTGGNTYNHGETATLTATANNGYRFIAWNDGNAENPRSVVVTQDSAFIATFAINAYIVKAESNDATMGSVTGGNTYNHGETAILTATANNGYRFVAWNDQNTENPRSVVVTQDSTFTATFAINTYTIAANVNDATMGSVTGGNTYNHGETATLTATANNGYRFVAWNDQNTENPRSVVVTQDSVFTATFTAYAYIVTAIANDATMGSVTGGNTYNHGETATLTATANNGYRFVAWNDQNTENPRSVVVTKDSAFTANFTANAYIVTAVANDATMGSVIGGNTYNHGETATLTATANNGYRFVAWNDQNTENPRSVVVTQDSAFTATFTANAYIVTAVANDATMGSVIGGNTYNHGETATLTATENNGYRFVAWNDGNSENPRSIVVTKDSTFTATFAINTYIVTAEANDATMGSVTGSDTYNHGETATLTATANNGYRFVAWNDGNSENPRSVVVTQDSAFTATFTANVYIVTAVANDATMGSVTGGNTYNHGETATLTATANNGYRFVAWNDQNTENPRSVVVTQDSAFTATFTANAYIVTAEANDATMGSVTGSDTYNHGKTATLTATANNGYRFVAWNDGNSENPRSVVVTQDSTFTATFAINAYIVKAEANDATMGSVTGGNTYNYGETAMLTATPVEGYRFIAWNDQNTENPRSVVVTQDSAFTATFTANAYIVTAEANDATMGSVTGSNTYNHGETATLTATANSGYRFVAWNDQNTENPRNVVVTQDSAFTATFAINTYTIAADANDATMGSVTGSNTYNHGETATLTATANNGYRFVAWNDGNAENPRRVVVTKDSTFTATFTINTYTIAANANDATMGSVTGGNTYNHGETATLKATANNGYRFVAWNDGNAENPRRIVVTQDSTFTATFTANAYIVTAVANDATMGFVTGGNTYNHGETATLTATANNGYRFVAWNDQNTENPRSVVVTKDSAFTATFAINAYIVKAEANDATMGSVTGGNTYNHGETATLTATPVEGYRFVAWNDGNSENPRSVVVTKDSAFTATFVINSYTIAANANDATMGSVTGGNTYNHGETATLTATANNGYRFVAWNDQNTENPRRVVVTKDSTFTATFAVNAYIVKAEANDATMGSVIGGNTYNHGETATLTATANNGYRFVAWNDGNTENPRSVVVTKDSAFTATFAINTYIVKAESNDATMGSVTGSNTYNHGETATLTATEVEGYHFTQWNDGNSENPRRVVVTKDSTFTAKFAANSYKITVKANNTTMGRAMGGGTYDYKTTATLIAAPAENYHFVKWNDNNTDNPRKIIVTNNATYTATFEEVVIPTFTINVVANNAEMGNVTGSGEYAYNTNVTISASPNEGYSFERWLDNNTSATRTINVTQNKTFSAIFAIRTFRITAQSNDSNKGTVSGGGNYKYNETVTITATPKEGYYFEKWSNGSIENPVYVTVTKNEVYSAVFGIKTCKLEAKVNDTKMGKVSGMGSYNYNTNVTLTATPNAGYKFVSWDDGITTETRTITLTEDMSLTANFEAITYMIATNVNNPSMGSVEGSGEYDFGSKATITAVPNIGFRFSQWNDGNKENPRTITVSGNATYTATFVETRYIVSVNLDSKQGTVIGTGSFDYNGTTTLQVTPANGYIFSGWSDGNKENPRTIVVTGDITLGVNMVSAQPFTIDSKNYEITSFDPPTVKIGPESKKKPYYTNAPSGDIVIPATIEYNGMVFTITSIDAQAFRLCQNITSITLPETITSIGDFAFTDCSSLQSINIPASVVSIGQQAFKRCEKLTELPIGKGVQTIDDQAYSYLNLETIIIPASVKTLGENVFRPINVKNPIKILKKIVCEATVPPTVKTSGRFPNYDVPLYVPASSISAYQNHAEWGKFKTIKAIE